MTQKAMGEIKRLKLLLCYVSRGTASKWPRKAGCVLHWGILGWTFGWNHVIPATLQGENNETREFTIGSPFSATG